ncbi:hypothetical protein, partial [Pseudoalteromonas sp.]|uniref:hypothetical protein n=1 Tax=Pseudoalteromonas sp. TaxID=53249 RepID=UPI003D0C338E
IQNPLPSGVAVQVRLLVPLLNPSQLVRVFLCLKKVVSGLERHAGRGTEISKSPPTGTTFMTPADLLGFFYA